MSVTGYTKAGADAAFAPVSSAWQASTAVKAGQLLTHTGTTYVVNSDFTTPASFNTTGLTVVGDGAGGGGSTLTPTAVKTGAYTAVAGDFVPVNAAGSTVPIALTAAPADKAQVVVKKIDGTAAVPGNPVTITTGGSDVFNKAGGSTTVTLIRPNQSLFAQYQASTALWLIIAVDPALTVGTTAGTVAAGDDARMVASGNTGLLYINANYR